MQGYGGIMSPEFAQTCTVLKLDLAVNLVHCEINQI